MSAATNLLVCVQESKVGLANDDVIRGSVGVELLVPLLEEPLVNTLNKSGVVARMSGTKDEQEWSGGVRGGQEGS